MANYIEQLKNQDGDNLYPVTTPEAIRDKNGKAFDMVLADKADVGSPARSFGRVEDRETIFELALASEGTMFSGVDSEDGFTHYIFVTAKSANVMSGFYVSSEDPSVLLKFAYSKSPFSLDFTAVAPDVVDNLTTEDGAVALSANQGKVLKGLVDKKAENGNVVHKTGSETIEGEKTFANDCTFDGSSNRFGGDVVTDTDFYQSGHIGQPDGAFAKLADLSAKIGELSNLETEDKTNLVAAINEAAQSGGDTISFQDGRGEDSVVQTRGESLLDNDASGDGSFAHGAKTKATSHNTHAEGHETEASAENAHAEGDGAKAQGQSSHAEGGQTNAVGPFSHAEGFMTEANAQMSHAEGAITKTNGEVSHAEGVGCVANGDGSHAEGGYTQTTNDFEHAEGYLNESHEGTIHSVGMGGTNAEYDEGEDFEYNHYRLNAHEIMKNGDHYVYGIGGYRGDNPSGAETLQVVVNGKYAKPSTGIPKTDLASDVRTSLGKADTALQSYTETDPVFNASAAKGITTANINSWNGKYTKPSTGIPSTDLSQSVQQTLAKVEEIYQDYIDANNLI